MQKQETSTCQWASWAALGCFLRKSSPYFLGVLQGEGISGNLYEGWFRPRPPCESSGNRGHILLSFSSMGVLGVAGFLLASGQGGDHSSSPGCGAGPEGAGHQHHPGLVHLLESPSMLLKMLPPDLLRPTKTYSPGPGPKRPNLHQGLQKSLTLPVAELPTGVPIFGALSLWFMVRGQGPGAGAGGGRAHSRPNCGSPSFPAVRLRPWALYAPSGTAPHPLPRPRPP